MHLPRIATSATPLTFFVLLLIVVSSITDAYSPRMSPLVERSGDGTITVSPANEADQSALVVICHGLGDSSEGFADGELDFEL